MNLTQLFKNEKSNDVRRNPLRFSQYTCIVLSAQGPGSIAARLQLTTDDKYGSSNLFCNAEPFCVIYCRTRRGFVPCHLKRPPICLFLSSILSSNIVVSRSISFSGKYIFAIDFQKLWPLLKVKVPNSKLLPSNLSNRVYQT